MSDDFKPANADKSEFEFDITEIQGHNVLVLSGDIDAFKAPQLKQSIISILDEDTQHLILDMFKVDYIDSTVICTLIGATKRLKSRGGTLNLVGCSSHIERVLCITKVSPFITLHENMDDALKALSA
jgi:anti-sigma B factor antagonist